MTAYAPRCSGRSDRNGGFSRADPNKLYLPVNAGWVYGYQAVNVERQIDQPDSLLQWTRQMLEIRRRHRALSRKATSRPRWLQPLRARFPARIRRRPGRTSRRVLCVHNLSRHPQPVQLNLASRFHDNVPVELTGGTAFPNIELRPYLLTLPGYGSYWFSITPARQQVPQARSMPGAELTQTTLHHALPESAPPQIPGQASAGQTVVDAVTEPARSSG